MLCVFYLLTRASLFALGLVFMFLCMLFFCVFFLNCVNFLVSTGYQLTSAVDDLERLVGEVTYYVLNGRDVELCRLTRSLDCRQLHIAVETVFTKLNSTLVF